MSIVPNLVIQQIASGAVIPGTAPLISTAAPNIISDVIRQVRGRVWTYKDIDSGSGGLFDSPVKLANTHALALARASGDFNDRRSFERINAPDRIGYSVRRIQFRGGGTTAVTASVINPFYETASVASESLTVSPSPNGSRKEFTATLANGNLMYETFSVRVESSPTGSYDVTLLDRGDERLATIDANGSWIDSGAIDYKISPESGSATVRMRFSDPPPTGATFTAKYDRGTSSGAHEFFDTAFVSGIDPANFNVGIPVTGSSEVVVPPYWHVSVVSTGVLSTTGSVGLHYGVGFGQIRGQESPGFGVNR